MADAIITRRGGGGIETGKYVWKRYAYSPIVETYEDVTNLIVAGANDSSTSISVFYGNEYTYDKTTKMFSLKNPQKTGSTYSGNNTAFPKIIGQYFFPNTTKDSSTNITSGTEIYKAYDDATYSYDLPSTGWYWKGQISKAKKITSVTGGIGDFQGYVFSDDETAYPNNAALGNYWYYRCEPIFMYGLSKEAHGSFTPSSNSKSYSITHNLGSKPKLIVIYTDASLLGNQYAIRSFQCVNRFSYNSTSTDNSMQCIYRYNNTYYDDYEVYSYSAFVVKTADYDESTFNLSFSSSSAYFLTGATYYWQAFA